MAGSNNYNLGETCNIKKVTYKTKSYYTSSVVNNIISPGEIISVDKVEKENSSPVISKAQVSEKQAEDIVADEVDVVEEEEYEEIVIPSRTELNRMKKNQINELAKDFEFSVKMTDTKAVMIDSFLSQVDEYILQLQESGDFVSATTDDEDGDTDNIKDGGHF